MSEENQGNKPKFVSGIYRASELINEINALEPGQSLTIKRQELQKISAPINRYQAATTGKELIIQFLWKVPGSDKDIMFEDDTKNGTVTFTKRTEPAPLGTSTYPSLDHSKTLKRREDGLWDQPSNRRR